MHAAATTIDQPIPTSHEDDEVALPLRSDTLLGVCEAIGRAFGISGNWLRVPLSALVLWNPMGALGIYLALGLVVALAHFAFRDTTATAAAAEEIATPAAIVESNDSEPLSRAA